MTLPDDFITQAKATMGDELWTLLAQGLCSEAPVSIRLNPWKCREGMWTAVDAADCVAWCSSGYYLNSRPNFTFDPMLHAGMYYVQEASSMFLDLVLRQYVTGRAVRMLDMCAAPGGKSTVARAALPAGSLLVSNEPMRTRAQILAENIQKFGHPDVIVTNNYPQEISRSGLMFDIILTDVPCSGEGMFRKDPVAINEWSPQNVEKCRRLQREIVAEAWQCLRPGGLLVYSTCTFNTKEDEDNVSYICEELGAEVLPVDIDGDWKITGSLLNGFDKPVYRFLPGLTRGEGLFMAVLRKPDDGATEQGRPKTKKQKNGRERGKKQNTARPDKGWITSPDDYEITENGDTFTAIPKAWKDVYDLASRSLKVLSAGVELGEIKGKDIVPAHALALSTAFNAQAFPSVSLNYAQAISYLRKEAVTLPPDTPRGYVVMTYHDVPLGFMKNIGNRANNLYPAEWKIKSTHIPEGKNNVIIKN